MLTSKLIRDHQHYSARRKQGFDVFLKKAKDRYKALQSRRQTTVSGYAHELKQLSEFGLLYAANTIIHKDTVEIDDVHEFIPSNLEHYL